MPSEVAQHRDSEGEHLCTRNDLGFMHRSIKGLAWGAHGQLAVTNGSANKVRVWY